MPGMSRVTGNSGAGVLSSAVAWSGSRSATAVRIAPRLTRWSRARAAMERPSRYAVRTPAVCAAATAGRCPPLLPYELHGGQQLVGARVAGGEVHRGERAVVDAQRGTVSAQDIEHVEDVLVAAYEAEHLGDVHGVARPRVGEQFTELRALERVETAGGTRLPLEDDRVLEPGLGQDEVLPGGGLLVRRDPL